MKHFLTTGQISKLCGVAPRTVCNWIDSKLLVGHKIPNSRYRRVKVEDLTAFLALHKMPALKMGCVVTIGLDESIRKGVEGGIQVAKVPVDIVHTEATFAGGFITHSAMSKPWLKTVVVADLAVGSRSVIEMGETMFQFVGTCRCFYLPVDDLTLMDHDRLADLKWEPIRTNNASHEIVHNICEAIYSGVRS